MSKRIECFLITETTRVRRSLRRYASRETSHCPGPYGYHNASVVIVPLLEKPRPVGEYETSLPSDLIPHEDPRWPVRCEHCAYEFGADDPWQVNDDRLYENVERGILTTLCYREVPAGAMWYAWWNNRSGSRYWRERGGGPHLVVMTPGGEWDIDQKSQNGEGWQWSGEPPHVTANPSIHIVGRYHGWLRDGVLIEC